MGTRVHKVLRKGKPISTDGSDTALREQGSVFMPRFDSNGLLSAVAQHVDTGEILMLAFMNEAAVAKTIETGFAHFYSRSRKKLWMKGETSGHVLKIREILVDCDQDALIMKVDPAGPACHTNATSCFYRKLDGETLVRCD